MLGEVIRGITLKKVAVGGGAALAVSEAFWANQDLSMNVGRVGGEELLAVVGAAVFIAGIIMAIKDRINFHRRQSQPQSAR